MGCLVALTDAAHVSTMSGGSIASDEVGMSELILHAGIIIARWCGYPPASAGAAPTMEPATYTLYSQTNQVIVKSGRELVVEPYPVTSITSIHDDPDEEYTAADLVVSTDYLQRGLHGEIIRLKADSLHGGWSHSQNAIKIVCQAGFSSIPDDLEHAATELVLHMYNLRSRRGVSATSSPDGLNVSYRTEEIPDHVKQLLCQYRLPSVYMP